MMLSEKKTNSHAKCYKKSSPSVPNSNVESNQFQIKDTPPQSQKT